MRVFILLILMGGSIVGCSKSKTASSETVACTTSNPDRWTSGVSSIVQNNCVSCHGDYSTYSGAAAQASSIASQVNSGNMPRGSVLSEADKTSLVQWAACNAPE